MKVAKVFWNGQLAGILTQHSTHSYEFDYDDAWLTDATKPPISLTFPKSKKQYQSDHLFPFFFNMLAEGVNKQLQNRLLKIDERDYFGLLLATSSRDSIGAVSVVPVDPEVR